MRVSTMPAAAMQTWDYIGLAALGLAAAVILIDLARHKRRLMVEEHLSTHPPMPPKEFLRLAEIPAEHARFALGVREGLARAMSIPPETVHPSDTLEHVCRFGADGLDLVEIIMQIESVLRISIPDSLWKDPAAQAASRPKATVAALARFLAERIQP
jgi:acyl carrier protein